MLRPGLLCALAACGSPLPPTVTHSGQASSYVIDRYAEPFAPLDVLWVVDSASLADPAQRQLLLDEVMVFQRVSIDAQLALTTTDLSACELSALDGRCGRPLAIAGQPFIGGHSLTRTDFTAALDSAFDVAATYPPSPDTAAEAQQRFVSPEGFRRDDTRFKVVTAAGASKPPELSTAEIYDCELCSMCFELPQEPLAGDPTNVSVQLGHPDTLLSLSRVADFDGGEGWYYRVDSPSERTTSVCLAGSSTQTRWLSRGHVLRIQVVTDDTLRAN
jgi:hypothetical protein